MRRLLVWWVTGFLISLPGLITIGLADMPRDVWVGLLFTNATFSFVLAEVMTSVWDLQGVK